MIKTCTMIQTYGLKVDIDSLKDASEITRNCDDERFINIFYDPKDGTFYNREMSDYGGCERWNTKIDWDNCVFVGTAYGYMSLQTIVNETLDAVQSI